MDMNTSLYFKNLTDEELLQILNVISVPCLMEPLKKQAHRYFGKSHKGQSLSREAVNHIYLKFLKAGDLVLSLYLSDLVVDVIHFFKLSDGFKRLLTTDDPAYPEKLAKKIKKRHCPISVDMFMRLLDAHYQKEEAKVAYDIEIEEMTEAVPEEAVIDEGILTETIESIPEATVVEETEAFENSDFFDVLPEVSIDDEPKVVKADPIEVSEHEESIEIPNLDLNLENQTFEEKEILPSVETEANEVVDAEIVEPIQDDSFEPETEVVIPTVEQQAQSTDDTMITDSVESTLDESFKPETEVVIPTVEQQVQSMDDTKIADSVESTKDESFESETEVVIPTVEQQAQSTDDAENTDSEAVLSQTEEIENQSEETSDLLPDGVLKEDPNNDVADIPEEKPIEESAPVVFEEKNEDALMIDDQKIEQLEKEISGLQYQIMSLQMENESLKDENRDLLFQGEDESEKESLKQNIDSLVSDNAHLKEDMVNLTNRNQELEKELADFQTAKENENQMRLELREFKIKYISLQSEYDQLQYKLKNDNKRLKELENKQRTIHESKEDLMLALHDLNWYKKQWHLPGDAPIHQIWSHLNNVESQKLKDLMKKYDRMVKSEKQEQVEGLKEILLVKEAILILLKANRQVKNKSEDTTAPF